MWRFAQAHLDSWSVDPHRKPLVIRGARQVGKSTLVRQFAQSAGLRLAELNLEKHASLLESFRSRDVQKILQQIGFLLERRVDPKSDLLFLDEIQAIPEAYAALRYFHEDLPELRVVAAGSLLEVMLDDAEIPMPVGRLQFLSLGPMTFFEFLRANGKEMLAGELARFGSGGTKEISRPVHEAALDEYWNYLYLGGMPEVIARWIEDREPTRARELQIEILETYQSDFGKYRKRIPQLRLEKVFDYAARNVGRKVKYSDISREDQSRDIKPALELLEKARVITRICHSNATRIPLEATRDEKVSKLLFLDVGLMGASLGLRAADFRDRSRISPAVLGSLAEQFVGQHFVATLNVGVPRIHYWLREGKTQNAEVDFVLQSGAEVIPVECKSGVRGTHKSLVQFADVVGAARAIRFDLNPPSRQALRLRTPLGKGVQFELFTFPLYLAEKGAALLSD